MGKLTELEETALLGIAQNDFDWFELSDAKMIGNQVWLFCIEDGDKIKGGKTVSGVVSSLTKKGLVGTFLEKNPKDSTMWITAKGFEELQKINK